MTISDRVIDQLYLQRFSCAGDGMHLELCIADASGHLAGDARPYPLATIRADAGDQRRFVFYTQEGPISVPLEQIEKAIQVAKLEVHSEEFYD